MLERDEIQVLACIGYCYGYVLDCVAQPSDLLGGAPKMLLDRTMTDHLPDLTSAGIHHSVAACSYKTTKSCCSVGCRYCGCAGCGVCGNGSDVGCIVGCIVGERVLESWAQSQIENDRSFCCC